MDDQVVKAEWDGPRPVRVEERDQLIAMINFIFRTSLGREPTIAADWHHVYEAENLANVMVVSERGRLVASTGIWASDVAVGNVRLRVGGINCVGTLPEYRCHGLGSQTMKAAQRRMAEAGCHLGLLDASLTNWYRRLGWESAGRQRVYRLNRGNIGLLPKVPDGVRVRFVEAADGVTGEVAKELVRLRAHEQLGAMHTGERFQQLLVARKMHWLVLAEVDARSLAYLLLRDNHVLEWAGPVETVVGLARACFERLDDPHASTSRRNLDGSAAAFRTLTLATPGWQHPLVTWLDSVAIPYAVDYLGMIYVVEPQALLAAYNLCGVQVDAAGDDFVLRLDDMRVRLNRSQLAKLFFGPERVTPFAAHLFPLPFWQWGLDKV